MTIFKVVGGSGSELEDLDPLYLSLPHLYFKTEFDENIPKVDIHSLSKDWGLQRWSSLSTDSQYSLEIKDTGTDVHRPHLTLTPAMSPLLPWQ